MSAIYTAPIWKFSDPPVRSSYESISPRNVDSPVFESQYQSDDGLTEPIAKLIGQCFLTAFSGELQLRGLIAGRMAMRTSLGIEELRGGRSRTRVELDVVAEVPGATHNQLIDALASAKRRCSADVGLDTKILLKAELKPEAFEPELSTNSVKSC